MEILKEKIMKEGRVIGSDRINVDGFINHQVDVALMTEMAAEFKKRFQGEPIEKILTIEASGIPIAMAVAQAFGNIPLVFAKKAKPNTMTEDCLVADAMSFTKSEKRKITVAKKYIIPGEKILIVDDFLAHGEASEALCKIIERGKAQVAGVGVAICKERQGGKARLEKRGHRVEALVVIENIENGQIIFK